MDGWISSDILSTPLDCAIDNAPIGKTFLVDPEILGLHRLCYSYGFLEKPLNLEKVTNMHLDSRSLICGFSMCSGNAVEVSSSSNYSEKYYK